MTLTTREAATRLGVTTRRIRQMAELGDVKAKRHGRDWMIDERSLEHTKKQRERVKK